MNRVLLIAQREFMENMRTKTFWIGILAFPVILVIAIGVSALLSKTKGIKTYAVLDLSAEELGEVIESTARSSDLRVSLKKAFSEVPNNPSELTTLFDKAESGLGAENPYRGLLQRLREVPPQVLLDYLALVSTKTGKNTPLPPELTGAAFSWFSEEMLHHPERLQDLKDLGTAGRFRQISLKELVDLRSTPAERELALNKRLDAGDLFAYFVIPEDPVGAPEQAEADDDPLRGMLYVSKNLTDNDLRKWYSSAAAKVLHERRIARASIAPATATWLKQAVQFTARRVDEEGKTVEVKGEERLHKFAPIGFVYLLWIAVFMAAQMLLTNTVEEKSNRIIEVLLSSVSPSQLMSGKIWGIAATGLTIVGSWVAFALIGVKVAPLLVPGFDFALGAVIGDPLYLASFVAYFLGGYLLNAAVLVAIGSVCNSLKEAQNLLQPVVILLFVPLLAMIPVAQEPNGTMAKVLTYIPLYTPYLMMNRAGGPPPAWEYVVTGVIIVVSVMIAFWAAGKIFRIGVLMTGKPPRLKEILGWLRAPAGAVPTRREP